MWMQHILMFFRNMLGFVLFCSLVEKGRFQSCLLLFGGLIFNRFISLQSRLQCSNDYVTNLQFFCWIKLSKPLLVLVIKPKLQINSYFKTFEFKGLYLLYDDINLTFPPQNVTSGSATNHSSPYGLPRPQGTGRREILLQQTGVESLTESHYNTCYYWDTKYWSGLAKRFPLCS